MDKVVGRIAIRFRGNYVPGTAYKMLDAVKYDNGSYVSKASGNNTLPTDSTKWNVLTKDGTGPRLQAFRPATYALLPTGLNDTTDINKAYTSIIDGLTYVWDGTAYQDEGYGINFEGPQGDAFTYADFTAPQLAALKGAPFVYSDFTAPQLLDLKGASGGAEIKEYDPADAPFLEDSAVTVGSALYQALVDTSADPTSGSVDWRQIGGATVIVETLPNNVVKFDKNYKKTIVLTDDTAQVMDFTNAVEGNRVYLVVQTKGFKYFLPKEVVYNPEDLQDGTYTIDLLYTQGVVLATIVSTFPNDAYYLKSLEQSEIDYGRTQSDYLVLRQDTRIDYPFQRTIPNNTVFDSTEATIDCYSNPATPAVHNTIFMQSASVNVQFKCGIILGDRLKRPFVGAGDLLNEGTYFVAFFYGARDVRFSAIDSSGFMGDTVSSNQNGSRGLLLNDTGADVLTETNPGVSGIYLSAMLPLYPLEGNIVAIYGGIGFNRFPPIKNAKLYFYNASNVLLSTVDAAYLQHIKVPDTATKFKVSNEGVPGQAGYFFFQVVLNPASGQIIENSIIRDHHRGGVSNVNNDTVIVNTTFINTTDYNLKPAFPDTTRYAINPEDAVSNSLKVLNCKFISRYHSLLVVDLVYLKVKDCVFSNNVFNIYLYHIKQQSSIKDCVFNAGGMGTEGKYGIKHIITVANNVFNNSAFENNYDFVSTNNVFNGGIIASPLPADGVIKKWGKFENNVCTECFTAGGDFRGQKNNVFEDFQGLGYISASQLDDYAIVPANTFINLPLKSNSGGTFVHNGGSYTYTDVTKTYNVNFNTLQTRVFHNATLTGIGFIQDTLGGPVDLGSHYFYNCIIDIGIAEQFFLAYNNVPNTKPNRFYFKNCTVTCSTPKYLVVRSFSGYVSDFVLDNCTLGPNVLIDVVPTIGHVQNRVRYIRIYGTGSNVDTHTLDFRAVSIYAFGSAVDLALGKTVKRGSTGEAVPGITDGSLSVSSITTGGVLDYIEIDLGSIMDIAKVNVKRIVGRRYYNSKVVFSEVAYSDAEVTISSLSDYTEGIDGNDFSF